MDNVPAAKRRAEEVAVASSGTIDCVAHRAAADQEEIQPPPASAATADPVRLRRPVPAPPSSPTGGVDRATENGLPDDTLAEIFLRLPAKTLCRFKCVSKHWRDLIAGHLLCRPCTLEGFFYGCVDDDIFIDKIANGGSEDSNEGDDGEDGVGEDGAEGGGSKDGAEGGGAVDDADEGDDGGENFPGHFKNLSERYVPLVDPQFSFLRNQPGVEKITLFSSCSGLLLFAHTRDWSRYETPGEILQKNCSTPGYIVCNPTTEHWVPVPSSTFHSTPFPSEGSLDEEDLYYLFRSKRIQSYLVFNPAISLHFELIELHNHYFKGTEVRAYSSETGRWGDASYGQEPWSLWGTSSAFVNGLLHVFAWVDRSLYEGHWIVVAIDVKGNTCRQIDWSPQRPSDPIFLGQSKGYLHSISFNETDTGFNIWILEDYHSEKWNLKHTVSFLKLFGREITSKIYEFDDYWDFKAHCNVVFIHPDCNEFFVVWENELISYDMDRDALTDCNVGRRHGRITPYFPYFSELPALSKKH